MARARLALGLPATATRQLPMTPERVWEAGA